MADNQTSYTGQKRRIRPVRRVQASIDLTDVDVGHLSLGTPPPPAPTASDFGGEFVQAKTLDSLETPFKGKSESIVLDTLVPEDFGMSEFSIQDRLPRRKVTPEAPNVSEPKASPVDTLIDAQPETAEERLPSPVPSLKSSEKTAAAASAALEEPASVKGSTIAAPEAPETLVDHEEPTSVVVAAPVPGPIECTCPPPLPLRRDSTRTPSVVSIAPTASSISARSQDSGKPRMHPVLPTASPPTAVIEPHRPSSAVSQSSSFPRSASTVGSAISKLPGIRTPIKGLDANGPEFPTGTRPDEMTQSQASSLLLMKFEALKAKVETQDEALSFKNDRILQLEADLLALRNSTIALKREREAAQSDLTKAREDLNEIQELKAKIDSLTTIIKQQAHEIQVLNRRLEQMQAFNMSQALESLAVVDCADTEGLKQLVEEEIRKAQESMAVQNELLLKTEKEIEDEILFWKQNLFEK